MKCHVPPIKCEMPAEMCRAWAFLGPSTQSTVGGISCACQFSEIKLMSYASFKAVSGPGL